MWRVSAVSLWALQLLLTLGEALLFTSWVCFYVGGIFRVCMRPFEGVGVCSLGGSLLTSEPFFAQCFYWFPFAPYGA